MFYTAANQLYKAIRLYEQKALKKIILGILSVDFFKHIAEE